MSKTDREILFSGLALVGLIHKYGARDIDYLVTMSTQIGQSMARCFPNDI